MDGHTGVASVDRVKAEDLELVDPATLEPHPDNPRTHDDATIRRSIEDHGVIDVCVVQRSRRRILGGHGRWENAQAVGASAIPVLWVDCDDEEAEEILLVLNRAADQAGYQNEALARILGRIKDSGRDVLRAGWDSEGLRRFVARVDRERASERAAGEVAVPILPTKPKTKHGDLWTLGTHRVLCGDATAAEDYDRVLAGEVADLCLTDPPYGVGLEYGPTFTDSLEAVHALIDAFVPLTIAHSTRTLITSGYRCQWRYPQPDWCLAWVEPAGVGCGPWGFTCTQPILAYGTDPYLAAGLGSRPDTFIGKGEGASDDAHPVAKPLTVWRWLLERGSPDPGQTILDPFGGAGTTLIAAEQLQRHARIIELEPGFCDVIVTRWETLTGEKATRA